MSDFDLIPVGKRIRSLRRQKKLTRESLSLATGLSLTTLRRIEAGHNFEVKTLVKIADQLHISADYLLHGDSHPNPVTHHGNNPSIQLIIKLIDRLVEERIDALGLLGE